MFQSSPGSIASSGKSHGRPGSPKLHSTRLNCADDAVAHQFARHAKFLHRALHRAGLQDAFVLAHGLHDFDGLVDVVRQRLFAIDILAGAQRGQRRDRVPVVGRGDADGVDVLAGDQFAEIVVRRAVAVLIEFVHLFLGVVAAGGVHVANRERRECPGRGNCSTNRAIGCPCR